MFRRPRAVDALQRKPHLTGRHRNHAKPNIEFQWASVEVALSLALMSSIQHRSPLPRRRPNKVYPSKYSLGRNARRPQPLDFFTAVATLNSLRDANLWGRGSMLELRRGP
jgi:hypothetical protein